MDCTDKQPRSMRRVLQGFTLVEMMVVIAIIGILLTVLVPAMNGYYTKSRLSTANSDAKLLFNSLQTICQEYEFADRTLTDSSFYGQNRDGVMVLVSNEDSSDVHIYVSGGDFTGYAAADMPAERLNDGADTSSLRCRLMRLYEETEQQYWIAIISGYQVRATLLAPTGISEYIGAYPIKTTEKNGLADVLHTTADLVLENVMTYDGATDTFSIDRLTLQNYVQAGWNSSITIS